MLSFRVEKVAQFLNVALKYQHQSFFKSDIFQNSPKAAKYLVTFKRTLVAYAFHKQLNLA